MTNVKKLRGLIEASGLKRCYIAERLGLTVAGFRKKANGDNEFVASEIKELADIFSLTSDQVQDIFLS